MRKIIIEFKGENEDELATAIVSGVGDLLAEAGVESELLSKKEQAKPLLVPAFMIDTKRNRKATKNLAKRRAKYGRKWA